MIIICNRRLNISYDKRVIAMDGDNATNRVDFRLDGLDYADWDFVLDTRMGSNPVNPIALAKTIDATGITLTWNILSNQISAGNLAVAIRAFKDDQVWQTSVDSFTVESSLNAAADYPSPVPAEFTQIEQTITAAKDNAAASASAAATSETNAKTSETNAGNSATSASGSAASASASASAASTSETNAKTSETNAKTSETSSAQALSDLLAALGVRVATLGQDGKLTPSQIPALSINDVFSVPDTASMLALTAQRGDCALIVSGGTVSDSYLLAADDATQIDNWKKLSVSYVANAGHANTADAATDSTMINGKRIVGMTAAEYASAVTDPSTFYLVGE